MLLMSYRPCRWLFRSMLVQFHGLWLRLVAIVICFRSVHSFQLKVVSVYSLIRPLVVLLCTSAVMLLLVIHGRLYNTSYGIRQSILGHIVCARCQRNCYDYASGSVMLCTSPNPTTTTHSTKLSVQWLNPCINSNYTIKSLFLRAPISYYQRIRIRLFSVHESPVSTARLYSRLFVSSRMSLHYVMIEYNCFMWSLFTA